VRRFHDPLRAIDGLPEPVIATSHRISEMHGAPNVELEAFRRGGVGETLLQLQCGMNRFPWIRERGVDCVIGDRRRDTAMRSDDGPREPVVGALARRIFSGAAT
jgi:hypothetical protein